MRRSGVGAGSGLPVPNTVITSAVDTAASDPAGALHRQRLRQQPSSPVDTCTYRHVSKSLPLPAAWNGRFMIQGGGGSEGSVPTATGPSAAPTGITEVQRLCHRSQNGGHRTPT